jgi:hypothetical protein
MTEPSAQPNQTNPSPSKPGQSKSGGATPYMTDADKKAQADKTKTAGNHGNANRDSSESNSRAK